ncbi:MAG: lipid A export permease/ATP-binding protein MsbA [Alphaproteobacteria bacterium]|nr:lipid A export permease/ATP-binding protein MsbA [Alphaproteobacteria bacterium]
MVLAPRTGLGDNSLTKKKKLRLDHSTLHLVTRLAKEGIRPYAGKILLALCLMAVVAATTAMSAWLMDPVVNKVFVERRHDMLWTVGLAVFGSAVIKGIANYGQTALMSFVGLRIIADLQDRLFRHMLTQDIAYFHATTTGRLLSRFSTDTNLIRAAVSNALVSFGKDSLSVIFLVGVMFYQDWTLAAISFFIFPLTILPIVKLGQRIRRVTANTQEEWGLFSTLVEQCFQGIRVVKAYGMASYETSRVSAIVEKIFKLNYRASRTRAWSSPIMETIGGVAVTVVVIYGGSRVIEGTTTAGAFFSFITALLMAYQPMKALAGLNANLQEGLSAAQRVFEVLDTRPSIQDAPGACPLDIKGGAIHFDNVHFSYGPEKGALLGLSLDVPAGTTVALVGPSGAGKSTIQNLIARFYDVQSGTITVDGQNVQDVQLATLRDAMALVSQEVVLFDDTIRANIAYGREGASQEEIEAAAKGAAAHDFITLLPQGYDTTVGEHGVKLSGGQRQRLAIARAMLRNAPILLLDEATSALDTESERAVQSALDALMQGRTTLVIAHRLSTITHADLIYVIDQGRVAEKGTHADLLTQNGLYARLHALQQAAPRENGHGAS